MSKISTLKGEQVFALSFSLTDVPGTATTAALHEVGGNADGILVPFPCHVIGVSIRSNADRTAGTATANAVVNGVASTALAPVLNATDVRQASAIQGRGITFAASPVRIGAQVVTSGWTPTTADVTVTVFVLVETDSIQ